MRPITHIMIHHSATKDGDTVSWAAIENFHKNVMNWNDIGYHFGIEMVLNVLVKRWLAPYSYQALVGRPINQIAAACPQGDMNRKAIHICCVGDYDRDTPTKDLYERLYKRLIQPLSQQYSIPPANWVGHRDYNPAKTCPGNNFNLEYLRSFHGDM